MAKNFDIYDFVHNNKITLKVEAPTGTKVSKGYNDIRKTGLNEVKIVNGKFSIAENMEGDRKLSPEVKKHFLEIISTYNTFQNQMKRQSDLTEVANTLGGIVEAAKEMTLRESGDWFDAVTVKRNMNELDKLGKSFDKFAIEAKAMDERLHSLYEDMGHILNRYYEIADIPEDTMKERLGMKDEVMKPAIPYKLGNMDLDKTKIAGQSIHFILSQGEKHHMYKAAVAALYKAGYKFTGKGFVKIR
jgi:ribosomal protein L9